MTNVSAAYGELTTQFYSCFYYYHNPNYFSRWQSAQLKNTFPRLLCWLGLARCCNFGRWDVNKSLSTRLSVMFLRWQPCPSGICLSPCPPHFVLSVPETVEQNTIWSKMQKWGNPFILGKKRKTMQLQKDVACWFFSELFALSVFLWCLPQIPTRQWTLANCLEE